MYELQELAEFFGRDFEVAEDACKSALFYIAAMTRDCGAPAVWM